MSLPRSLNMSLNRFSKATSEIIKVMPHRQNVSAPDQISYRFPGNAVIDLQSLSLLANVTLTKGSGSGTGTRAIKLGDVIRRFDILIGGTQVWGASVSAFQDAYHWKKVLAEPQYSTFSSARCFELVDFDQAAASSSVRLQMQDVPGLSTSNIRFLPLSAIGELEIRISLDNSRIPSNNAFTCTVTDSYFLVRKLNFDDNLLEKMVAAQLQSGVPIEMVMENWATYQSPGYTGSADFNVSIATQSLDYLLVTSRDATPNDPGSHYVYTSGSNATTDATYQINLSGTNLTSFPLNVNDCFAVTCEALDGLGNILVDPRFGTSLAEYRDTRFLYAHRLSLPSVDSDESHRLVSGLSTYGLNVPITFSVRNAQNAEPLQLLVMAIYKSTVEIGAGRVITVVN